MRTCVCWVTIGLTFGAVACASSDDVPPTNPDGSTSPDGSDGAASDRGDGTGTDTSMASDAFDGTANTDAPDVNAEGPRSGDADAGETTGSCASWSFWNEGLTGG